MVTVIAVVPLSVIVAGLATMPNSSAAACVTSNAFVVPTIVPLVAVIVAPVWTA